MKEKTIDEINEIYELEIDRIITTIKKEKAKNVLLQFPEGMKPYSLSILKEIERQAKCHCFIWLDSCFGACDVPIETEHSSIDLIVQFGHSKWDYKKENINILLTKK
jgi:2-(3-amino-3-carboxypropyl)histidine synthase